MWSWIIIGSNFQATPTTHPPTLQQPTIQRDPISWYHVDIFFTCTRYILMVTKVHITVSAKWVCWRWDLIVQVRTLSYTPFLFFRTSFFFINSQTKYRYWGEHAPLKMIRNPLHITLLFLSYTSSQTLNIVLYLPCHVVPGAWSTWNIFYYTMWSIFLVQPLLCKLVPIIFCPDQGEKGLFSSSMGRPCSGVGMESLAKVSSLQQSFHRNRLTR